MGFLDRQSRVLDVVLTDRGRELFALGELDFSYYAFFDDGIDYDPWSTGSLSDQEREDLIHSTPMFEASVVPRRRTAVDPLGPICPVFGASPDYSVVPRVLSQATASLVLSCEQVSSGSHFIRTASNSAVMKLKMSADVARDDGFSVRFFHSGSNGLSELRIRRDLAGRRAIDPFVAVSVDDETPRDLTGGSTSALRAGSSR